MIPGILPHSLVVLWSFARLIDHPGNKKNAPRDMAFGALLGSGSQLLEAELLDGGAGCV